ncbi:MAG: MCE family protein [Chthoniobacterales bacterium]|nr:MCE family protein [Chthoniobacterales bacterium]
MSSDPTPREPDSRPIIKHKKTRFSAVWIIPLVAALFGLWLTWKYYSARGPEITVRFETAEGIIAGKTPVLCRSVNIGTVDKVQLTDKLKVRVTLEMTSDAAKLLVQDTQIWVVRPRYGGSGISGLSTIVSGNYIELEPGLSKNERTDFIGLEQPPVTPKGVPGLHIKFMAEDAGGIDPGSPITYKGIGVGKIEKRTFRAETGKVVFDAFIEGDYEKLVHQNTKFWNTSGIDLEVGANGVKLRTGTLEGLLVGGITFNESPPEEHSPVVADGAVFTLFTSFEDTEKFMMQNPLPYLLLFTESVRGLNPEAPVEFRGIRIGTVDGASFKYLPNDPDQRVPVMIRIDPDLITELPSTGYAPAQDFIARNVAKGLRASLKSGNLLTGQMFIDLDFQKNAKAEEVQQVGGYEILPTGPAGGLAQIQEQASALLAKLQALPLEKTVNNASDALASIKTTADELKKTASGFNDNSPLYHNLSETLRQLDETLRSLRSLTSTLDRKPNSIIFGKPGSVPPPKGSDH